MRLRIVAILLVLLCTNLHAEEKPLERILFGSCNKPRNPQPLWGAILENKPDLWIWLGDIIYDTSGDPKQMKEKYDLQKAHEGYAKLLQQCKVIGIWDDNDYGENNGGKDFPIKNESQKLLLEFLGEPQESRRWIREGGHVSYLYGPVGKQVKIILLDDRYNRESPGKNSDILGEAQWQWLENELRNSTAQIHLIGSGIQVLPTEHPFERWDKFPKARKRLLDLIGNVKPVGTIILSGDRHLGEISKTDELHLGYDLYDITSSGMTHYAKSSLKNLFYDFKNEPNRYRVGKIYLGYNFGMLHIDWNTNPVKVTMQVRNEKNEVKSEATLDLKLVKTNPL